MRHEAGPTTTPAGAENGGTAFRSAMIVDDHPLFLEALSMTLRGTGKLSEVATASTLEEALGQLEAGPAPDLVLLDLDLPDVSGLHGLVRIRNSVPEVPIIVVSSMLDNRMIASVLQAGARGFVPKQSSRDVFCRALDRVGAGETYVPDGIDLPDAGRHAGDNEDALRRLAQLTRQQAKILALICEGRLNKQIAYDLSIAETTVKAHVTAIMRKLGVQSRTQAVLVAQKASFARVLQD